MGTGTDGGFSSNINMDEIAAHGPLLSSSLVFSIFTILTQVTSFQLDFSGLKKKEFLTSHQQQLLQLAESLSQQKLLTTFDVHPTGEDPYQNRVKRGYGKKKKKRKKTVHKCASSN